MKRLFIILAAFLVFSVPGCNKEETEVPGPSLDPKPIELPAKGDEVVARSNEFGFDLFRQTALEEPEKNMMLSPLSASVALTMLLNGCANNTYEQIHSMLGYDGLTIDEVNKTYTALVSQLLSADPKVQLALGNAVFYHNQFAVKPPFLLTMNDTYQAHIEALDFFSPEALDVINQWASDNTMGKIPKVLNEINAEDVMYLMNALYFKGTWTFKFDESQTHTQTFHNDDGTTKEVDMMTGDIPVRTVNYTDYHAIELYYGRQNFSMVLILSSKKVNELLQDLDGAGWQQLTHDLDAISSAPDTVELTMPKFSFDYEKKLNEPLQALGMTDAFQPGVADLSKISDQGIFVSFVKQNSFISLDEEGTEAAAVTVVGIGYGGPVHIVVDHSFLFAIRERTTNTLMFVGKVMAP
jgi:serpin B